MYADHNFAPGYRPLQGVRPCLKCLVGTSWCRCDVEAAERQRKRAESPSTPANDFAGFRKSVKTYSWEDGRHADPPDPHVGNRCDQHDRISIAENGTNTFHSYTQAP